jgi:hypothetical protein
VVAFRSLRAERFKDGTSGTPTRRAVLKGTAAFAGLAAVQASGLADPTGSPAWKTLPSWAVVAAGDKAAGSDVVRSMAQRAGAEIVEVEGSHVIMVSQPQAVVDLIVKGARAASPSDR